MKRTLSGVALASLALSFLLSGPVAVADSVNVSAAVWGTARDSGRNGSFETISFPTAIILQSLATANVADRGIWEFDLAELPAGNITSIVMKLIVTSTTGDAANFDVYGYSGDGTIQPADATGGELIAANLNGNVVSQSAPLFIDVTSFILDPARQSAGFAGFYARYPNEPAATVFQKQLQDPGGFSGNGSPLLTVTYSVVPVPAAFGLLGTGLVSLLGFARRRSAAAD